MKKFGWKVGDRVPLHSTIWTQKTDGSLDWTFDIVGTFDAKDPTQASQQAQTLLFHYELFDEGRSFGKGTVGWFEERVDDPTQSAAISAKIDALFANSSNETKTQPAKEFALAFIKQLGDIGFVLRAILGAVFFTLLFLTGNTMMQSVRERIPELAVLKTIGFGDGTVLALVIGESLLLCLIAAVIGLGLSYLALPIIRLGLQGVELSPSALMPGIRCRRAAGTDRRHAAGAARHAAEYRRCAGGQALRKAPSAPGHTEPSMFKQLIAVLSMGLQTLPQRLGASSVIVIGIAGVVAVLVSVLAMGAGFEHTLADSGRADRAIILRGGSDAELNSNLDARRHRHHQQRARTRQGFERQGAVVERARDRGQCAEGRHRHRCQRHPARRGPEAYRGAS